VNGEGLSAFGTSASVVALYPTKSDLYTAARTFAINVCLAVFPFVSLQEDFLLDSLFNPQKASILHCTPRNISRKHTKKDQYTKRKRDPLQNKIQNRAFHKKHKNGNRKIHDQHKL
jgi:hypothetical protein